MKEFSVLFWDFDGVIKDSVDVKTTAFRNLFLPYGSAVAERVSRHHEANGGMSRYDKMPLYLEWAGEAATPENVRTFCDRFSGATLQAVIDAPWVPGVREYLLANYTRQYFVLLTATPQADIERIAAALHLDHCLREIHGAPTGKAEAIANIMGRERFPREHALMIGDSETDVEAARKNGIAFRLRRTQLNKALHEQFHDASFDEL